jgi:phosphoribosylaminoimidazole-succinocarboxamide synthase
MTAPVLKTSIHGLPRFATGKVRDVYDLGDTVLLVTTDRISAFDVVMPNGIPHKGSVLTQLSRHWFRSLRATVPTHYITCDEDFIMERVVEAGGHVSDETRAALLGRSMLGVKATAFPIECVVRGYLAGSLWKEYVQAGGPDRSVTLHGISLPGRLLESEELPQPIFTPATKAEAGHDENISVEQAAAIVGQETIDQLAALSLELYTAAAGRARKHGIIIADTKFEFGLHRGVITLIDEALTPDSSRFWDATIYEPGRSQPSYDKQFVRDWLLASGWNREPPAPTLPEEVVRHTSDSYLEAYRRIAGRPLRIPERA